MWRLVKDEGGMTIWERNNPLSRILAVRARTTMKASIEQIVHILLSPDADQKRRWVDLVSEWEEIERGPDVAVVYAAYALPFPLSPRDFVLKVTREVDTRAKTVTIKLCSVKHQSFPESRSIGVRGRVKEMRFKARMISRTKTEVTLEAQVDLGGDLPNWAVNIMNRAWPENTLRGLEAEAVCTKKARPGTMTSLARRALTLQH